MRIQPRQHLLDIWRATARASYSPDSGDWLWGGREPANSISDAEQLLCIMLPATEIPRFRLDRPNQADEEVIRSLRLLGDAVDIPRLMVRVMIDYLEKYTRPNGSPDFSGGSYFSPADADDKPTDEQSTSTWWRASPRRSASCWPPSVSSRCSGPRWNGSTSAATSTSSRAWPTATVGRHGRYGPQLHHQRLRHDVGQRPGPAAHGQPGRRNPRRVTEELQESLQDIAAGLRDLNVGIEQVKDLDRPGRLFECGWSWGITKGAPEVDVVDRAGRPARRLRAWTRRTCTSRWWPWTPSPSCSPSAPAVLGLLNEEQQRLARRAADAVGPDPAVLGARSPSFGSAAGRWRTSRGAPSTASSPTTSRLLVTSIAARDLAVRRDTDADLGRARPGPDRAGQPGPHHPARRSSDDPAGPPCTTRASPIDARGHARRSGPQLSWVAADFAPLLLKRAIRVAEPDQRHRAARPSCSRWPTTSGTTCAERRIERRPRRSDLWDQPGARLPRVTDVVRASRAGTTPCGWSRAWSSRPNLIDVRPAAQRAARVAWPRTCWPRPNTCSTRSCSPARRGGRAGDADGSSAVRQRLRRAPRDHARPARQRGRAADLCVLRELDALAAARQDAGGVLPCWSSRRPTRAAPAARSPAPTSPTGGRCRAATSATSTSTSARRRPARSSASPSAAARRARRRPALLPAAARQPSRTAVDVWAESDRDEPARPAGRRRAARAAARATSAAASSPSTRTSSTAASSLLLRLDEEFDICLVDLSAGPLVRDRHRARRHRAARAARRHRAAGWSSTAGPASTSSPPTAWSAARAASSSWGAARATTRTELRGSIRFVRTAVRRSRLAMSWPACGPSRSPGCGPVQPGAAAPGQRPRHRPRPRCSARSRWTRCCSGASS